MLTNETRRQLLNRAKAAQFPGSILEVYRAAEQGIDILADHEAQMQQQMQVAQTPQEQQTGLREEHARGNTQASMAFPNVQPGQSFNTVGMKAPINVDKYDNQGHLVESYKNVPPGIQDLPTGPYEGTVIETPAEYQEGGFVTVTNEPTYEQKIKDTTGKLKNLEKKVNKSLGSPMADSFNYSAIPNYDVVAPRYEDLDDKISLRRYKIRMEMFDTRDQEDFDTRLEEARKNDPELIKLLAEQKKLKAEYPTITQMTGDGEIRDALRHTAAGYKTSKAIENKVKNVPYIGGFLDKIGADKLAGFVGSNVLGAGHEAIGYLTSKDWRDSKAYEDMYNNFMGTKVALFGNKSPNSAMREILSLQKQGKLKKGRVEDKQKGGLRNHMMQYLHDTGRDTTYVNTVMNAIGQHESKNNPKQVQVSGNKTDGFYDGPGRGTYQFEVGPDAGGNTAINRTANFLKYNTDKTIHDFPNINTIYNASNSLDFTNLSKKDQDALFIGDKIFGGVERRNEFDALTRNRNTPPTQEETFNYWLNNHKGKVNGKNISELTQEEIEAERKKWNARTKKVFNKKRGGYKPRFL